jgi:hypothetical protein
MSGETISAEQAASFVESGMWLDYGATHCQPDVFAKALAACVLPAARKRSEGRGHPHGNDDRRPRPALPFWPSHGIVTVFTFIAKQPMRV